MTSTTGVIGRTVDESTPSWVDLVLPEPGAPNVVLILLDDTGFAHLEGADLVEPPPDVQSAVPAGDLAVTADGEHDLSSGSG